MEKIKKYWLEIIGSTIMLICLFYVVTFLNNLFNELYINSKTTECYEIYGSFGSYVGGILGTIIGFITLILVFKTYTSQKKELKLQSQLITQQQFESTFFNMLNVHRELKNGLNYSETVYTSNPYKNEYLGLEVINFIDKKFTKNFNDLKYNQQNKIGTVQNFELKQLQLDLEKYEDKSDINILAVVNNKQFKDFQNQISHYCRNAYHILKYIRENEENKTLSNDFKKYKNYANIFQSQLNVDEQFLLFYNFIYFNDKENEIYSTINLVNHYKFLENIGIDNLILKKHEEFYDFVIKGSDRKIEKK